MADNLRQLESSHVRKIINRVIFVVSFSMSPAHDTYLLAAIAMTQGWYKYALQIRKAVGNRVLQ
jgi:hypothetical protein